MSHCQRLGLAVALFGAWFAAVSALADESPRRLFDGRSLAGWESPANEEKWWRAADGAIGGGSLTEAVPHNIFLATRQSFENFDLTLKIRIHSGGGFSNSGIQIRSQRVPNSSEMKGFQVDAGDDWWGKLYDESRRNRVLAQAADLAAVNASIRKEGWNEYRILAEGPRIRTWINGVAALDYVEEDPAIPRDGLIGVQVHGGGKTLVELSDIQLRELPPGPGGVPFELANRVAAQEALSPADEARCFQLPDEFSVELVAAESPGIGKFVAVDFDAQGRLWTMTALEYPVDANESSEVSRRLFAEGGRDKLLVIDRPCESPVAPPRVFAEGLAIPLGILPWKKGALVQYGHDIRYYADEDGDGKADRQETILTGFGTQDSHLFPHQFTRVPGGEILVAQGLFNDSTVVRPDGKPFADGQNSVRFPHCKLAAFAPDGTRFEPLTAGPNNIWGLTISREGETWLQEANDLGFPVIPYAAGGCYPTGSADRLRPYQPMMPPPLAPAQMGGTGLSGLALADDADGWPVPWGANGAAAGALRRFYIANPITNSVQCVEAKPEGVRYSYAKGPNLLTSADRRFRPVALKFGPDGCLYVVDWYNKIISHNEVPRAHPERDKTTGRIWRIRHRHSASQAPPVPARMSESELLANLGHPNTRMAEMVWQQIVDRPAPELSSDLERLVADRQVPVPRRLGALWALEGLAAVKPPTLRAALSDSNFNVRREGVRIAGRVLKESEFVELAWPLVDDLDPRVRASLGDSLRRTPATQLRTALLMMRLGSGELGGEDRWAAYDRAFERFLARWAMERVPELIEHALASPEGRALPIENRIWATLSLPKPAIALMELIPQLDRPPGDEEIRALGKELREPSVAETLRQLVANPRSRRGVLQTLLRLRTSLGVAEFRGLILEATQRLWNEDSSEEGRRLACELVGAFQLHEMHSDIIQRIGADGTPRELRLAGLRAIREAGGADEQVFALATRVKDDPDVRLAALTALASNPRSESAKLTLSAWEEYSLSERTSLIERLASHKPGCEAILASVASDALDSGELPIAVIESIRELLPSHPGAEQMWNAVAARLPRVLALRGQVGDIAGDPLTLTGPFTVESWVRLEPGIDNRDSLLGVPRQFDINFAGQNARVWAAGRDVVIAKRKSIPDVWSHYAFTRDNKGRFGIFVDGELDVAGNIPEAREFPGLRIGQATAGGRGTRARFSEFRVWNRALSPEEIRDNFDRSYFGEPRPTGLVVLGASHDWGKLDGNAKIEASLDAPNLISAAEAAARAEKFARFRQLAERTGDSLAGKTLFEKQCLICHQQAGRGGRVGPPLDGIGLNSTETLLRNILTPSAAMEGGYRAFRALTKDGRVVQGMLVSRDERTIVLRQPDTADVLLPTSGLVRAEYTTRSIMPDLLLESFTEQQVSDLFAHLRTLNRK